MYMYKTADIGISPWINLWIKTCVLLIDADKPEALTRYTYTTLMILVAFILPTRMSIEYFISTIGMYRFLYNIYNILQVT